MDYEIFIDKIKNNTKTKFVTIPKKIADFAGLKVGDRVKIMIKKI